MKNATNLPVGASAPWQEYLTPTLGKKIADLFDRRTQKPLNAFIERVIRPVLFLKEAGTYVPVTDNIKTLNRNSDWAELIASDVEIEKHFGCDPLWAMTYFANQLRVTTAMMAFDDLTEADRPSQRVCLGRHVVLTLEFDVNDPAYLGKQIAWVQPKKNPLECPMGNFYKALSEFSDFVGITVVYGGNKSLHIHVVFDTTLADEAFGLSERSAQELRRGYMLLWDRNHTIFKATVDTGGHEADRSLRQPEQYRRLPWGNRVVGKGHILGVPEGTQLPQITLWEVFRNRAGGDAMFLTPDVFASEIVQESKKVHRYRAGRVGPMSPEQFVHCQQQLGTLYPDRPCFVCLELQNDRWVAKFANSPRDRNPSSVMKEDYQTVRAFGTDAHEVKGSPLPLPLGEMLRFWCETMPGGSRAPMFDADMTEDRKLVRELEDRFSESVRDKASAHDAMQAFFDATVPNHSLMMPVGPEGIGKTTTLFKRYHIIARRLLLKGDRPTGMFAFAAKATAFEKCADFNELQKERNFVGVMVPSLTHLYEEVCEELRVKQITRAAAIRAGFANLFEAIRSLQPEVIKVFRRRHEAMWATIGDKTPVFFVVHQTMHLWKISSATRLMAAKSFWSSLDAPDQTGRTSLLRDETIIGIAVHDEIKVEHIVEMHPKDVVSWVQKLTKAGPWRISPRDRAGCLKSFEDRLAKGAPLGWKKASSITYDDVLKIESWLKSNPDPVIARDSGEYQIKALALDKDGDEQVNAYEVAHGAEWRVSQRDWWDGLANHVILLTTEKVPTALVAATTSPWAIFELAAPLMPRNTVQVHAQRFLTGQNLPVICADFRELHPDTYIISNKAKTVIDTMPPVTARGSNELIGKNVMQTMTHMTPGQYEELQVLNAWTGRSDLVGLHHIDEFNQSAGRNLGFRYQEGVTHTLLVNRRLFRILATGTALGHCRYTLQPILDKDQRYGLKKASKDRS